MKTLAEARRAIAAAHRIAEADAVAPLAGLQPPADEPPGHPRRAIKQSRNADFSSDASRQDHGFEAVP